MSSERNERVSALVEAMRSNERDILEALRFTEDSAKTLSETYLSLRYEYFGILVQDNELLRPSFMSYERVFKREGDVTLKDLIIRVAENFEIDPTWWAGMTDKDWGLGGRAHLPEKLREMADLL